MDPSAATMPGDRLPARRQLRAANDPCSYPYINEDSMGPLAATRHLRNSEPSEPLNEFGPVPKIRPLRIGPLLIDPPILQAPMAGYTNYPFRQIVRELGGAGLLATEMGHAKGVQWVGARGAGQPRP